ncbi:MAG TPA: RecX family transcriptional regulator [Sphingomicrobium sp.]|nr:RecX family transcriptional regulator [Sphingomicrobium sp.]
MSSRNDLPNARKKPPSPLDQTRLDALALAYVGRFATTRAKLAAYLLRKLRERGWEGGEAPAIDSLAERLARLGYIDDASYALAKGRSLGQRGFGRRRVSMALRAAGVREEDGCAANEAAAAGALTAALRFAERRRLGPYSIGLVDPKVRQRGLAAMVRAGHDFDLARKIIDLPPGEMNERGVEDFGYDHEVSRFHDTCVHVKN